MFIIFGKSYCGYCKNLKKQLKKSKEKFLYLPLEEDENNGHLKELKEYKLVPQSYSTVPVVILYKNDKAKFIGGHDKTLDFCKITNKL
jgi:glutaredoxin